MDKVRKVANLTADLDSLTSKKAGTYHSVSKFPVNWLHTEEEDGVDVFAVSVGMGNLVGTEKEFKDFAKKFAKFVSDIAKKEKAKKKSK